MIWNPILDYLYQSLKILGGLYKILKFLKIVFHIPSKHFSLKLKLQVQFLVINNRLYIMSKNFMARKLSFLYQYRGIKFRAYFLFYGWSP